MKVGIVGGGQLARMMALAGYALGLQFKVLDPAPDACAGQVATLLLGAYDAPEQLHALATWADVVTFDFENVPAPALALLEQQVAVYPPSAALAIAQDRVAEKTLFRELGIPTAQFAVVDSLADLQHATQEVGLPALLKTRRLGYDGKGQRRLHSAQDVEGAWADLGNAPLILESLIPFEREVSLLAVRGRDANSAYYPLVENTHQDGILHCSRAPCAQPRLEQMAGEYAQRILQHLDYVGVLAIEFFVVDGELIANEMAPRVHNSGHWTLEGAATSQFENHLRAILGLPLGATAALGHALMLNALGTMPDMAAVLAIPHTHYHAYGKQPRPGRKVGHITVQAAQAASVAQAADALAALVGGR